MKKGLVRRKMGTISFIMILFSISIASGFSVYDYVRERARLTLDFNENIGPVVKRLSNNLQKPLWVANEKQALKIIESEMINKRIYAIVIRESGEKTVFCARSRDGNWKIVASEGNISGDFILKKAEIIYEEESMGLAEIYFTTRFIRESLKKLILFMVIKVLLISICLVSVLLLTVHFFLVRPLSKLISGLDLVGAEVGFASGRIASSGWTLRTGASKQAAAVGETSAALEEMDAMIRLNTQNVSHANKLMTETSEVVHQAAAFMKDLTCSIDKISETSEETRKVINTIEEIAFQTNLLALNAAVEAAHAGKAGAGFAVVAEEVRTLALRSEQAVENTSKLIEASIEKTKSGIELVCKASEAFTRVTEGSKKMEALLDEVAASSQEQARGIIQVSNAMNEIDKVTQENSVSAEKTFFAIEEIKGQIETMKNL